MKRLLGLFVLLPALVFAQSSQVNLAGLASKLLSNGTVPLSAGGTGVTTAAAAINQLLPSQTGQSGTCLGTNGSSPSWVMCGSGGGSGTVTDGSGTTTASQFLVSTTTAHTYAVTSPAGAIGALNSGTANAQTGTTYTLVIGDANSEVTMNNASSNTLTIPPNASVAFPVGTIFTVQQLGAGITTVSPGSGVTIQSPDVGSSTSQGYPLGGAYGFIQLQQVATNTWNVIVYKAATGTMALSGTCTHSANSGDAYGGGITMSSAGDCTIIVTPMGVLPALHLWTGTMWDQKQPTIPSWGVSNVSTTAPSFPVPTAVASSDVLAFSLTRH